MIMDYFFLNFRFTFQYVSYMVFMVMITCSVFIHFRSIVKAAMISGMGLLYAGLVVFKYTRVFNWHDELSTCGQVRLFELAFTCAKAIMETAEQCVKSIQSYQKDTRTTSVSIDFEPVSAGWVVHVFLIRYEFYKLNLPIFIRRIKLMIILGICDIGYLCVFTGALNHVNYLPYIYFNKCS